MHQNNTNLATWSLGFEDKNLESIDERNLAALVAKKYKTDHTEISINSKSILNELSDMAYSLDEPYGGGLPSWFIYKEMSKQMKVCMTGTGGDELFGNYKKWAPYRDPKVAIRTILKSIKTNGIKNLMKYPKGGVYPSYMGELETNSILLNELHNYNSISLIDYKWSQSNVSNAIDGIAYTDFYFQLTDEFLHMTDRFSMNFSMEARTPFLDHELIDFVFSIDYRDRINPNNLKKLLIDSTSDLIPDEVINSSKRGFIIPHDVWLKNDLYSLAKKYFSKEFLRRQNIFSEKLINNLIDPYFNGNSLLADKVWTIFMFQFWWDTFQLRG